MVKKLELAPVIIFAYDRIQHLRQTIDALRLNDLASDTDIYIFSDGAKANNQTKVDQVRDYLKCIDGFQSVTVVEREKNYGLSSNIISGLNKIFETYKSVIVLEDDLVTSPHFLRFMNDALYCYAPYHQVSCLSGYILPVKGLKSDLFIQGADCWGWATWKENWQHFVEDGPKLLLKLKEKNLFFSSYNRAFDYEQMLLDQIAGNNSSWAIRWYYSCVLKGHLCLYPQSSFVINIGHDGSGTHSIETDMFGCELVQEYTFTKIPVEECARGKLLLKKYVLKQKKLTRRVLKRLAYFTKKVFR